MARIAATIVVAAMGIGFVTYGVLKSREAITARGWPTVDGVVVSSTVDVDRSGDDPTFEPIVRYQYQVGGKSHDGDRVAILSSAKSNRTAAQVIVDRYAPESTVIVHYDPRAPERSLLDTHFPSGAAALGGIGLALLAVGTHIPASMVRRKRAQHRRRVGRAVAVSADQPSADSLTPSELVLLHGELFAPIGGTELPREEIKVHGETLLKRCMQAALSGRDEAGELEFDVPTRDSAKVAGTGAAASWPRDTLESRLQIGSDTELAEVVSRWLREDDAEPWVRGVEKLKIMAVIRRLADVHPNPESGRRDYALISDEILDRSRARAEALAERLESDRRRRPDHWKAIDRQVESAMKRRKDEGEHPKSVDPWFEESAENRDRFIAPLDETHASKRIPMLLVLALVTWPIFFLVLSGAPPAGQRVLWTALVLLMFATVGWALAARLFTSSRPDLREQIPAALVFVPILAIIGMLMGTFGVVLLVGASLFFSWYRLRRKVGSAITSRVSGAPSTADTAPPQIEALSGGPVASTAPSAAREAEAAPEAPRALLAGSAVELPQPSSDARRRTQDVRERGPAVRRAYRRGVIGLATASTLLAISTWIGGLEVNQATRDGGSTAAPMFPGTSVALFLATVIAARKLKGDRARRFVANLRAAANRPHDAKPEFVRQADIPGVEPIQPLLLSAMGDLWLLTTGGRVLLARPGQFVGVVLLIGSVAIIAAYLWWIRRETARMDQRYPTPPPRHLLALRVFGSPSLDDFARYTDHWRYFGVVRRLDGPGTAGQKTSDVLHYLTGRLDEAIIKTEPELDGALDRFSTQNVDRQMQYPRQSVQCTDDTWKAALDRFIEEADAVVMDLCHFGSENRGCVYEISRLIEVVPVDRFLLLVDDTTDQAALDAVIEEAWAGRSPNAVNRGEYPAVRRFHVGGPSIPRPNESVEEWERRLEDRLGEDDLVGLLYDATRRARPEEPGEAERAIRPWALARFPRRIEKVRRIVLLGAGGLILLEYLTMILGSD